jgi:rSAM/selenodomain-associated transferase 1
VRPRPGGRRRGAVPATRQRLVLLGRWPAPGRCKRRLAAGIGARRAAAVQGQLLWHGLAAARQAAHDGQAEGRAIEVVLALSGVGPRAISRLGRKLPVDRLVGQGEGSLGVRLQRQVARARREGIHQLVLVGTDLPHLCRADLLEAFAALRRSALVLGPASDGGYWLIGLSLQIKAPQLFAGAHSPIPWGGARVWRRTVEAAAAAGLTPVLLAERHDLDRDDDLVPWR